MNPFLHKALVSAVKDKHATDLIEWLQVLQQYAHADYMITLEGMKIGIAGLWRRLAPNTLVKYYKEMRSISLWELG